MITQSQSTRFQRGWLGARLTDKTRPIIHRLLGRKVLKRPTAAQLGKLQQKFAKGPKR